PVTPVTPVKPDVMETTKVATPTIKPITSDFSNGILNISGTGEPKSSVQLIVNGRQRVAKINIDDTGEWFYKTKLKPGNYSVQVVLPELSEQLNKRSALTNISIPKPQVSNPKPQPSISGSKTRQKLIIDSEIKQPKTQAAPSANKKPANINNLKDKSFHQVKYGDTLRSISRRYKVNLHSLIKLNNISNKNIIEVGQILFIPR
ncbi:MAG: LysM peptidoglycan-binding domain-containing protein, partial [Methylococcales bacterium]|nr:LysM peptidoglycan-binding domain-containing protein [Methylococcales bacterium]